MREFTKDDAANNPILNEIIQSIRENHNIPDDTQRLLFNNRHIKNFCEQRRHFAIIDNGVKSLFIHYDMDTWYQDNRFLVKINKIGLYNDFIEYESARIQTLQSSSRADGHRLN